jgi:diazepam-binding inhibitor (GABA receptor modulating acyl-CoA-binding protein)
MAAKKPSAPAKSAAKPAAKAAPAKAGDLSADFEAAAARVKTLKKKPDDDTLLRLYSLYKQGAEGDVKGERPGFFDFVGGAKYDAWAKLKGTSRDDAMKKYVALVDKLVG